MKPDAADRIAGWVWPLLLGQLIGAIAWGINTHVRLAQIELVLGRHGKSLEGLNDVRERIVRMETKIDALYERSGDHKQ